ncbi:MAG: zinc dependent phospholipase C family protein [Defluviitaleaceae bacterium]|nr:zinc dependent phospholipase C family protein [Defluviitaleaceae bacterium]
MIIPTHRLVGKCIYLMLDEENKKKLHYRKFVWGNVKPDVLPEYKRVSHYYPANEAFVFELLERGFDPTLTTEAFSDLLGVLIHFLCDYTCIYHNNMTINEANSMRQHMQYECLLHVYAQAKIRKHKPEIIAFSCLEDVKYHIWKVIRRANLDGMVPDMKADFVAMMQMSASVVIFLLKYRA